VKELRELSGAGMMDCKAALAATDGDMDSAVDWLRKKGIAKADKKASRTAAEGLIGVDSGGREAAIVEVNSETDFVARNEAFQTIVRNVAKVALVHGDTEAVAAARYPGSDKSVTETIKDAVGTIGENLGFLRPTRSFLASITSQCVQCRDPHALIAVVQHSKQVRKSVGLQISVEKPAAVKTHVGVAMSQPGANRRKRLRSQLQQGPVGGGRPIGHGQCLYQVGAFV